MNRRFYAPFIVLLAFGAAAARAADAPAEDAYGYLENAADARAQAWFRGEAQRTRETLDAIPGRAKLLERVSALSDTTTVVTRLAIAGRRVFYLRLAPRQATAVLCMREGFGGAERVILDPGALQRAQARASIDWFVPSPDGSHVAFGISAGGSEDSVLRVLDVSTGKPLPFEIDRARFSQQLAWHPDGRSFFYARVPRSNAPGKRLANVRLYRHLLGRDAAQDEIVFA
ncbi:MAG TPA: hypothetical protein VFP36_02745, partial [Usitatibacter sp.]|nr:hypothetical protein [Usitatibacter sp.]